MSNRDRINDAWDVREIRICCGGDEGGDANGWLFAQILNGEYFSIGFSEHVAKQEACKGIDTLVFEDMTTDEARRLRDFLVYALCDNEETDNETS